MYEPLNDGGSSRNKQKKRREGKKREKGTPQRVRVEIILMGLWSCGLNGLGVASSFGCPPGNVDIGKGQKGGGEKEDSL